MAFVFLGFQRFLKNNLIKIIAQILVIFVTLFK